MTTLIRSARITDPSSPLHGSVCDILVRDGVIAEMGDLTGMTADRVLAGEGLHASPGWVEVFAASGEPGTEYRETLESLAAAAAAGGFTQVFVLPNTQPTVHDRGMAEYVSKKRLPVPVTLHPLGAVTRGTEGRELAELYDMRAGGAAAFTDGTSPIAHPGILIKALQYLKAIDGILIQLPEDRSIAPNGLMHEGVASTRLGLQGRPGIAEELMVARDLELARYTGSRLHLTGVSLPGSIARIRQARTTGVDVTCSVTPHHLYFCDEDLEGYDTLLRTDPPLRTAQDRKALMEAVLDGSVDIVSTHHQPWDGDHKSCEFAYAKPGIAGVETCFPVLRSLGIPTDRIVELLSANPRRIFGLPPATIQKGEKADLTVFSPDVEHQVTGLLTRGKNNPWTGRTLRGKIIATLNAGKKDS